MNPQKRESRDSLPTNNLLAIMIALFLVCSALSSYIAINNSRNIIEELTGQVSAQARFCVNKPPTITQNCSTTATTGTGYYCKVTATDPDNDTITFYDDTTLFDIDQNTGEIIFTPVATGTYSIMLTANDGKVCSNSNATTTMQLTISAAGGGGGGGGGTGGGGGSTMCQPQWECTPWQICRSDGTTTRTCTTLNNCFKDKPAETQNCIYLLQPKPVKTKPGVKQFYLCDFDQKDECFSSFGTNEDWVYTYKGKDSIINIIGISQDGVDISIDDTNTFFVGLERIKAVDVTGDGIEDLEFILHRIVDNRAEITVNKIRQVEVTLEKPVYISRLPETIIIILMFVYNYMCLFMLLLMIIAAMLVYSIIMRKVENKQQ